MKPVEFEADAIQVDAKVVAVGLGIAPEDFMDALRRGEVTSRFEHGIDEHAGLVRLTFYFGVRQLRIVANDSGDVVQREAQVFAPTPPTDHEKR
jgi:hypothetical protein